MLCNQAPATQLRVQNKATLESRLLAICTTSNGQPLVRILARFPEIGAVKMKDALVSKSLIGLKEVRTRNRWSFPNIPAVIKPNPLVLKASERVGVLFAECDATPFKNVHEQVGNRATAIARSEVARAIVSAWWYA